MHFPRYTQKISFEAFGLEIFLKIYFKLVVCTEQLNYKNILRLQNLLAFALNSVITLNPLNANFTKWSNTLKQFVDQTNRRLLPTNCLGVFDHFVGLALKGLKKILF